MQYSMSLLIKMTMEPHFSSDTIFVDEFMTGHHNIGIAVTKPCLGYTHYICLGLMRCHGEVSNLFLEASAINFEEGQMFFR